MSVENVKAFFEKVEEDKTLQDKLKELDKVALKSLEEAIKQLVDLAGEEGFVFTPKDFTDAQNAQIDIPENVNIESAVGPGMGCQPGMGLYIHVPVPPPNPDPPPDPPQHPDDGCVSTYRLKCGGHGLQGLR